MGKDIVSKNSNVITYKPAQPPIAKYLVIAADRGMTSEVNSFTSLKEAKRAFEKIASDYGYKPAEINGADKYDVSIWKLTKDRYEKVYYYE